MISRDDVAGRRDHFLEMLGSRDYHIAKLAEDLCQKLLEIGAVPEENLNPYRCRRTGRG